MTTLSKLIIRFRWILLVAMAAATAAFGTEIWNLTSNYEYESWLPDEDDVAELIRDVDREFSATMVMFAVLDFKEQGVFHADALALVRRITEELEGMQELFNVTSLLNVMDIRKIEDGIQVGELMEEIPGTDAGMTALREYVLGKERYVDSIVSKDARFTVVIIHIDSAYDELKVAEKVIERVKEVAGGQPCFFGGDPAVAQAMGRYSNQDFRRLVPAMFLVMVFVLAFGLRRAFGVVLPLLLVVICIVWTFGMKALLKYPFNMLSPSVAVMLIAIGSDYAVHIYNHFLRRRDIVLTMSEMMPPVIMSALTTVIGLLTFSVTGIPNLTYFGAELALGLSSACLISVILLPICIVLLRAKPGPVVADKRTEKHIFSRALSALGGRVYRRSGPILVVTCVLMVVMGAGITRISTDVDFVSLLPADSSPRRASSILGEHFGGMYANTIYFQGDLNDPAVLAQQLYVENFLRSEDMVASFNSLGTYIAEENRLFSGIHAVPETRQGVSGLWLLLEGEEMMEMIVSPEREKGLLTSFIRGSNTGKIKAVSERIRAFLSRETSDTVVQVDPARLPPGSAEALRNLRVENASRQLAWLAQRYEHEDSSDLSWVTERLRDVFPSVEREQAFPAVLEEVRNYLREDTVEVLPQEGIASLTDFMRQAKDNLFTSGFARDMERRITESGVMDAHEARRTVEGLIQRGRAAQRFERTNLLWKSLHPMLPAGLRENEHYEMRAKGVLWTLLGDHPVFFAKHVSTIPEIGQGVIHSQDVRIRQAGFPEIIARLEKVLLHSQYLSLVWASAAVFLLVSITQLSLRRGLASLLSVLIPLELVLGMMGWFGIPLDFGTVLNGALVIGLGIDGSIHFLHYYHHQREEKIERKQALQSTLAHVGRAVVTANATTCGGFLILLFAHTSAVRNFALTSGMSILFVTVSILTILPALVVLFGLDKDRNLRNRARRQSSA